MKNKKLILFLGLLFSFLSCSHEPEIEEVNLNGEVQSIKIFSENDLRTHIEQIHADLKKQNPQNFIFENPHSELFVSSTNNSLKSTNQTYIVSGYDKRSILKKYNLTFGFPYDSRIIAGVPYYTEFCEYIKYIEVPKGYSIVIPSSNPPLLTRGLLPTTLNMGYIPDTFITGYTIRYISTIGSKEKYALVTQVEEIIRNTANNQTLSPFVFNPYDVVNPSTFQFKYQLQDLSWN